MSEQHPMIVAMAKAMERTLSGSPFVVQTDGDGRHTVQVPIGDMARAALTALLEPTPDMVEAGGVEIARQFTDPWDVLEPSEEEAMGLVVDGDDAYDPAHKRVEHFAELSLKAMIQQALGADK